MNILGATLDHWGAANINTPNLVIDVDELPLDKMVYEEKQHIYRAEFDGYVSFFYYSGPGEGYAKAHFPIKMKDGTDKVLIGPWSSRAGAVNRYFPPCLDVIYIDEDGSRSTGSLSLSRALEALGLVQMEKWGYPQGYHFDLAMVYTKNGDIEYNPVLTKGSEPSQVLVDELTVAFAAELRLEDEVCKVLSDTSQAIFADILLLRMLDAPIDHVTKMRDRMREINALHHQLTSKPEKVFAGISKWAEDSEPAIFEEDEEVEVVREPQLPLIFEKVGEVIPDFDTILEHDGSQEV